jgi:MoxR-like ATPase
MIKRVINTNLLKKEETFRVMALGEAVRTPILLIGPPGVAKTAAVIDFAKGSLGKLNSSDLFLLETDEGTRSNAVKGNIDLEALTTTNKYKINSPITVYDCLLAQNVSTRCAGPSGGRVVEKWIGHSFWF